MNQGRHFLSKVIMVAVSALLICGLGAQSSLAKKHQDSAGPSFGDVGVSSSSSHSKHKASASSASQYPSDADNMMQYGQPAYGYEAGKAGYYNNGGNGGNNGNQSAVKLPFNSCCGKATRNSANAAAGLPGGYTTGNGSTPAFNPMANGSYANPRSAYVGAATNYGTTVPGMTQAGVAGGGAYGSQGQVPGMRPVGSMNGGSVPLQYGSGVPGTSF
ncbi:MAG: hypothetical protein IAF58_15255 [Leptolyngbya sp.]|nr:hypothetical protein [Candidatus Melainabacteria bacterium]